MFKKCNAFLKSLKSQSCILAITDCHITVCLSVPFTNCQCAYHPVEGDLYLPLLRAQQHFSHLGHSRPASLRPIQEAAGTRLLHHLSTCIATHESITTDDDGTVLYMCIGYDKFTICQDVAQALKLVFVSLESVK